MKILIILAYPNKNGFCYHAYKTIKDNLEKQHHEVRVHDLYEEKFDSVLIFNKDKPRLYMQRDPELEEYRNNLLWANHLVFIFPIWWSGMPAILKGYIDKVFAAGFAYKFKGLIPIGLLKNKSAWIITTYDTPYLYAKLLQQDYGNILKKQILKMCGIKKIKIMAFSGVKNSTKEAREKWLKKCNYSAIP
jgi:NAD(P)H dehydrogenase (quinone)